MARSTNPPVSGQNKDQKSQGWLRLSYFLRFPAAILLGSAIGLAMSLDILHIPAIPIAFFVGTVLFAVFSEFAYRKGMALQSSNSQSKFTGDQQPGLLPDVVQGPSPASGKTLALTTDQSHTGRPNPAPVVPETDTPSNTQHLSR